MWFIYLILKKTVQLLRWSSVELRPKLLAKLNMSTTSFSPAKDR